MTLEGKVAVVTGASQGIGRGVGRAIAALAGDANVMRHSGKVLIAAAVGQEYGFTDIDGRTPRPLTIAEV